MGFILFTIPGGGRACVESYWLCEMIIQAEGIMNYQIARMYNIEPLELFLGLLDNILLQPKSHG